MSLKKCGFAVGALALIGIASTTAWACLWDSDTLQMERLRFPGVLEIITGRFVRHSPAYYEWRIEDRKKKLETKPDDPALIDDLAVAYAKLGRPEEGIPLLEASLEKHPDRYETLSNLGTLLFFANRLDESKDYIKRALEINPKAHFGREKYQLLLTEYVQQSDLKTLGVMSSEERIPTYPPVAFARHVLKAKFGKRPLAYESSGRLDPIQLNEERAELRLASKGVLGMLHFADFESPVLLEALGDLLATDEMKENGSLLAARAYLRAAQGSKNPQAAERFHRIAIGVIRDHFEYESVREEEMLPKLKNELMNDVAAAGAWFKQIETNEQRWINEGRDVDRHFATVYYDSLEDTVAAAKRQLEKESAPWPQIDIPWENPWTAPLIGIVVAVILLILVVIVNRRYRRRVASSEKPHLQSF